MPEHSEAYQLAEYIHDSFFQPDGTLTNEEIRNSGVQAYTAPPHGTEQLHARGELDGQAAYQTLSKSRKNGAFYLSTVYTREGGGLESKRITPSTPDTSIEVLEASLFMQSIRRVLQAREEE